MLSCARPSSFCAACGRHRKLRMKHCTVFAAWRLRSQNTTPPAVQLPELPNQNLMRMPRAGK
eukprot:scaffold46261_cov18-Tisochrysis_lutea.AAC.1